MNNTVVKRHRPLQPNQLDLLLILYAFKFSTRALLANYLGKQNNTSIYSKLSILLKHEYIAMHYDKSYKLSGRPAEYYVLPKGLRALRDSKRLDTVTNAMIQAIYKDATVSSPFRLHTVMLFALRNQLFGVYKNLQFFTKRDMQPLGYFPKQLPDAFLSLKTKTETKRFFLEYTPADKSVGDIIRRLKQLIKYYEDSDWDVTDTPFPTILCICENGATERRLTRLIRSALYNADTDMQFYATTQKAIMEIQTSRGLVWTGGDDPDELLPLHDLM